MSSFEVRVGDVRDRLREMPDESVQCVVTSPPYWGLRDYGLEPQVWGGDSECDHEWGEGLRIHKGGPHGDGSSLKGGSRAVVEAQAACKTIDAGSICVDCGAWQGSLGLEPTPALFVEHMVEVLREVRRVLRDDGTLWLNLGDSYCADVRKGRAYMGVGKNDAHNVWFNREAPGLKPKDMVGIPWRVAFALQADGWWLRSDSVWHKPNPMPESVRDRPTKAHEYVFLLTKSARYFYDQEAVKERASPNTHSRGDGLNPKARSIDPGDHRGRPKQNASFSAAVSEVVSHRNMRSVWTIPTQPNPQAHFATFPEALADRCIKAGSAIGDTVLDPFCGSGTTGVVASKLGRDFIGVELNPEYAEMARKRIGDAPMSLFS